MQAETSIIEGTGSQSGQNLDRWGDYSAMTIDPVDDCTFWFTTEYLKTTGAFNWSTRIGSLKFSSCGGPTYTVTPSVGTGMGTVSPSSPLIVAGGATPSFTLTPATGYHIDSVGGTCGGSLNGSTYTTNAVMANCTVIASFAINTYTVTPSVSGGNGTISPSTAQTVNYNATTQFTLTPNTGYHIDSVGGSCGGSLNGSTYTTNAVMANCTVIASFAINTYTVTPSVSGGNGTISPSTAQTVNYNATTQFTLTPNTGYHIGSVGGSCGGSLNGSTYTTSAVTANCTVIASFAINTYTVTPSVSGGNGTISPSTVQTVNYNATTQFTLTPNTGYHIGSVGGSCGGSLNGSTYTTSAVTANCTVIASFAINTYTVTPSVNGGNGTISPSTAQTVNYNAMTQFTLAPDFGYHIDSVGGSCGGNLNGTTYTTGAVTASCSVVASFALDGPTLVFTVQPANVTAGDVLATIEVTEEDPFGSPVDDNAGTVDFSVAACGGSVDLGSATMVHGVATLDTAVRFYTVTDPSTLQVSAQLSALSATSDGFVVQANPDLAFADGFDVCRP